MERIRTVSGSGPVFVDSDSAGHCAYEIKVYEDSQGRVVGRGQVMGESSLLGRMSRSQHVEIAAGDEGRRFRLVAGEWKPGDRRMDVETGADIIH